MYSSDTESDLDVYVLQLHIPRLHLLFYFIFLNPVGYPLEEDYTLQATERVELFNNRISCHSGPVLLQLRNSELAPVSWLCYRK